MKEDDDLLAAKWITLWLLGICLVICIPSLLLAPFGRDQGIYAWMAEGVLQGQRLYLELWDHKGPLVPLLYAAALSLFGVSEGAVRLFDVLLLLGALGALIFRRGFAGWASALFFLLLVNPDWWRSGQPDLWVADLFIIAIALGNLKQARADFVAGLLFGSILWVKPVYGLLALPFCVKRLQGVIQGNGGGRSLVAAGAGMLVPVVAMVIWLTQADLFVPMIKEVVQFNLTTHAGVWENSSFLPSVDALITRTRGWADPLGWSAYATAFLALYAVRYNGWYGAALLVASWLCIALQRHFFFYHYLPFFAALSWLAGEGAVSFQKNCRFRLLAFTLILLLQLPFVILLVKNAVPFWQYGQVDSVSAPEGFSYLLTRQAADKVAELTTPEDKVYLWGYDALLFFLSHRQSASRYGFSYPLRVGDSAARRAEVMGVLEPHPPKLVVVQTADSNSLLEATSAEALPEFAALAAFIGQNYSEVWRNDGFIIYQRH